MFVVNIDELMELGKSFAPLKLYINSSESVSAIKMSDKNPNFIKIPLLHSKQIFIVNTIDKWLQYFDILQFWYVKLLISLWVVF